MTVNHSENFVDPVTGACTNKAENANRVIKHYMRTTNYHWGKNVEQLQRLVAWGTMSYNNSRWQDRLRILLVALASYCPENSPRPVSSCDFHRLVDPKKREVIRQNQLFVKGLVRANGVPVKFDWDLINEQSDCDKNPNAETARRRINSWVASGYIGADHLFFVGYIVEERKKIHRHINSDQFKDTLHSSTYVMKLNDGSYVDIVVVARKQAIPDLPGQHDDDFIDSNERAPGSDESGGSGAPASSGSRASGFVPARRARPLELGPDGLPLPLDGAWGSLKASSADLITLPIAFNDHIMTENFVFSQIPPQEFVCMSTPGDFVASCIVDRMIAVIRSKFSSIILQRSLLVLNTQHAQIWTGCAKNYAGMNAEEMKRRYSRVVGVIWDSNHFLCFSLSFGAKKAPAPILTIYESNRPVEIGQDAPAANDVELRRHFPEVARFCAALSVFFGEVVMLVESHDIPRQSHNNCFIHSTNKLTQLISSHYGATTRERCKTFLTFTQENPGRDFLSFLPQIMFNERHNE